MAKNYNKTFTNLKTVTHDTSILDVQKIMIRPKGGLIDERVDLVENFDNRISGLVEEIGNKDVEVNQDLTTFREKIRELSNGYTEYETNLFGFGVESGSNSNIYTFNIGSRHLPKGIIDTVGVYARSATDETAYNTEGCYLVAECYSSDGTLQRTCVSTNKVKMAFKGDTNVLNEWSFDDLYKIEDGFIKFIPSIDGISVEDGIGFGCLVDTNHTHADCLCVDAGGTTQNNHLVLCKFVGEFERAREIDEHVINDEIHIRQYERGVIESLYQTEEVDVFDNNVNSTTLGIATIKGFVLERPYIQNGYFTGMKWNITSAGSGVVYLHVTLKDKSGAFVKQIVSKNTQDLSTTGDKVWKFDEFVINDNVGSIIVTGSLDGINNGNTPIRVRTNGATNNDSDGSEVTNNNFIVNVIFRRTNAQLDTTAIESLGERVDDIDSRLETNEEVVDDLVITLETKEVYSTTEELATGDGEWNASAYPSSAVPHDFPISYVTFIPTNTNTSTLCYLAAWIKYPSEAKTYLGCSANASGWEYGVPTIWDFSNSPLVVPSECSLELFLTTSIPTDTNTDPAAPGVHIGCNYYPQGSGTIRWGGSWMPRTIYAKFSSNGHIGDKTHLTDEQRENINLYITNRDSYITRDELQNELHGIQKVSYYHDVWTNYQNDDIVDKANVSSFQFAKEHFATENFDRIEIPYEGNGTIISGFLCVQFYNSSNALISTHFSSNKESQKSTGRGICQFNFNETITLPDDYAFVRFRFVDNMVNTPSGTTGISFRVRPIKRNNSFTFNGSGLTNAYNGSTPLNWTVYVRVLERKVAKKTGITYREYDWTPDFANSIDVTLPTDVSKPWQAPTNGWVVSSNQTALSQNGFIRINETDFAYTNSASTILVRKGDIVGCTVSHSVKFYPCRSEEYDYRIENTHTPYDIWKGAVIYDEETGEVSVQDLYVPNASAWKSEVGSAITAQISSVVDEAALDSNGNLLFNIQPYNITNAQSLFSGSSITSFEGDLSNLTNATGMFASSQIASWNTDLPALTTGDTMFYNCSNFTSFSGDLSKLTSGWYMFRGDTNLTDVSFTSAGLASLTDGTDMFFGCSLTYTSLMNVLNALPSTSGRTISITVADSAADEMTADDLFVGLEVPAYSSSSCVTITYNGWTVNLTSQTGFVIGGDDSTPYDVSEANGYIPDASAWNQNVYNANSLNIVSVVDGVAYDGEV